MPGADELASLGTVIGSFGAGGAGDLLHGITSALSTLNVAANPVVNPIEIIEQAERNVGIGFMQQVRSVVVAMTLGILIFIFLGAPPKPPPPTPPGHPGPAGRHELG